MSEQLTIPQANEISEAILLRQERFTEPMHVSIMTVLLNYGDQFTPVRCVRGEWSGIKADLRKWMTTPGGLPVCPSGHVLLESSDGRKALGLVDVELR